MSRIVYGLENGGKKVLWFKYMRGIVTCVLGALLFMIFFFSGCRADRGPLFEDLENGYVSSEEMEANYLVAAQRAANDSLPGAVLLFRAAATMEHVHGSRIKAVFLKWRPGAESYLDSARLVRRYNRGQSLYFLLDSTRTNIAHAMGQQSYLVNSLFESLADRALSYREPELQQMYEQFLESEQGAYRLFSEVSQRLDNSFELPEFYMVCPECGSIYIGDETASSCIVCGAPGTAFIQVD